MSSAQSDWKNKLFFGDNLEVLKKHIPAESVDLVYLDPPFNSNATYNVLFDEATGEKSAAQIMAFDDTWHWGPEPKEAYHEVVKSGPKKLSDLLQALRNFLGFNDMMAYLTMMAPRLVELARALKPTGSIYLHCDPTASHYLRLLMDAVFGPKNYRNELTWKRFNFHADARRFGKVSDRLLFYTKSDRFVFNRLRVAFSEEYIGSKFIYSDADGRKFRLDNLNPPGGRGPVYEFHGITRAWRFTKEKMLALESERRVYTGSTIPQLKRYLDELPGQAVHDIWTDIAPINSQAKERLPYPTQKPEALLERVLRAGSDEGNLVLDPFCGCGTALAVAERLNRRWIGIDITYLAVDLIVRRLQGTFGQQLAPYEVFGIPKDVASARALAKRSRYQFESWAIGAVDARPEGEGKRRPNGGVDGWIKFRDDNSEGDKLVVVQVKSGAVNVGMVRDLKGTMDRERATIGAFITLERPTRGMVKEAAIAGFYEPEYFVGRRYPRVQILTIEEILEGKKIQYPEAALTTTFKRARWRQKGPRYEQSSAIEAV